MTYKKLTAATAGLSNPPTKIVFNQNAQPIMTIHPDGRITLSENAQPTEAAAACIEAMGDMIQNMIRQAEERTAEDIAAWLGDNPQSNCDERSIAADIRDGAWRP